MISHFAGVGYSVYRITRNIGKKIFDSLGIGGFYIFFLTVFVCSGYKYIHSRRYCVTDSEQSISFRSRLSSWSLFYKDAKFIKSSDHALTIYVFVISSQFSADAFSIILLLL